MKIFPAIDLRGGRVVRLQQGKFTAETVYKDDAVAVARSFAEQGAQWIHVVDLDAARTGIATNRGIIADIVEAIEVPVQSGGGIRDRAAAADLIETGVQRVVLGTAAVKDPELVRQLAGEYPGQIAVGLDAREGTVAATGWTENSAETVIGLVRMFADAGVAAFVVTDIARDGMLQGSDLSGLSNVLTETAVDVIASGGVGSLADLQDLNRLNVDGRRLAGVIVGKALYENRFHLGDALMLSGESS